MTTPSDDNATSDGDREAAMPCPYCKHGLSCAGNYVICGACKWSARADYYQEHIRATVKTNTKPEGATMGEDANLAACVDLQDMYLRATERAEAAEKERDTALAACEDYESRLGFAEVECLKESLAAAEAQAGRMREALERIGRWQVSLEACVQFAKAALSPAPGGSSGEADHG